MAAPFQLHHSATTTTTMLRSLPFLPNPTSFTVRPLPPPFLLRSGRTLPILCLSNSHLFPATTSSSSSEIDPKTAVIDLSLNRDGTFSARNHRRKVVVLWDLDNKPPKGPPYEAALALRSLASRFGQVISISAFANRHAFSHIPDWILQDRRQRRELDHLERKGLSVPESPYVCTVCGRKFTTNLNLRKHFRQLHERERNKKLARMRSLKGKKRQKYRERFVSGNTKYEEMQREILVPRVGYGLARELRRAGVFVKTVEDKPQAADRALKRQMSHAMNSEGVECLLLVSDDGDFGEMLRKARESSMQTVVVGDERALRLRADVWVSWNGLEFGRAGEELNLGREEEGAEVFDFGLFEKDDDDDEDSEEEDEFEFELSSVFLEDEF